MLRDGGLLPGRHRLDLLQLLPRIRELLYLLLPQLGLGGHNVFPCHAMPCQAIPSPALPDLDKSCFRAILRAKITTNNSGQTETHKKYFVLFILLKITFVPWFD